MDWLALYSNRVGKIDTGTQLLDGKVHLGSGVNGERAARSGANHE